MVTKALSNLPNAVGFGKQDRAPFRRGVVSHVADETHAMQAPPTKGHDMTPEEIKTLRQAHGLSVTQAARLVHVSDRTWQRYESGGISVPGAIAELFKIKVSKSE